MIMIKEDKSYLSDIDLLAVEKGIAELGIHSIRIDRYYTEEQKKENSRIYDTLSREQWNLHCEQSRIKVAAKIEEIMDLINDHFMVYQYKNKEISYSKDNWDLYFWCNFGDMSYVTLNPNKKRSNEQQIKDIHNVLDLIKTSDCEGIQVYIQHNVIYDKDKVTNIAAEIFQQIENKFVSYMGTEGKIKEIGKSIEGNIVYGFFKKGARKKYYQVSNEWFLQKSFQQAAV